MTPDSKYAPTISPGSDRRVPVSSHISRDFTSPVSSVVLRHTAVPSATVPKATVNKNCKALAWKSKIRTTKYRVMPAPIGNSRCPENAYKFCPGFLVPSGTDCCHNSRPLMFGKHIRHNPIVTSLPSLAGKWNAEFEELRDDCCNI
jgi:hypothetical protein